MMAISPPQSISDTQSTAPLNRTNTQISTTSTLPPAYSNSKTAPPASAPSIAIPTTFPITAACINFGSFGSDVNLVDSQGHGDVYPRMWYFSKPLLSRDDETSATEHWDWQIKMLEVRDDKNPFIIRRSKASKSYEIVSLEDGSKSHCREIKVSSTFSITGSSTKIAFEGLNGKTWAWKGSFNRGMTLFEYDEQEVGGKPKVVKTALAEYVRYSSRPILTIQEAAQSASLVVASLYPIIDLHREDFHRKYNFPSDNEIGEAKAANWDSRVLMVGEKERGERMARERDGQGSATHVLGLERNETNSSANTQVV